VRGEDRSAAGWGSLNNDNELDILHSHPTATTAIQKLDDNLILLTNESVLACLALMALRRLMNGVAPSRFLLSVGAG